MIPFRLSYKLFLADPQALELAKITPVFHEWIQQARVPGTLIDVADYQHMIDGPGILLVGHDMDYALDLAHGRPGLLHTRKRLSSGAMDEVVVDMFRATLQACRLLEQNPRTTGSLRFRTDEAELTFQDRLRTPNEAAAWDRMRGEIAAGLGRVYAGVNLGLARDEEDERRCLTVRITAPDAPDVATLLSQLAD